ncbi:MAG: hypothetical protein ACP5T1_07075 [Thermoplasmata archaeon]
MSHKKGEKLSKFIWSRSRFKAVARDLSALIEEAYNMISIDNKIGRPAKINKKQNTCIIDN